MAKGPQHGDTTVTAAPALATVPVTVPELPEVWGVPYMPDTALPRKGLLEPTKNTVLIL